MALVLADRVKETTSTTGTGTVTLLGAVTGFQSFAVIGNANTTYYTIAGQSSNEWEVGIGTYTLSGTTLARTTVLSNSSGTQPSALSFSAGTKDVFVTYPSSKSVNLDASGNATALGTPVAFVGTNITGTASGLTAGNVTTNANLTGDVTSVGNATSIAAGVIVNADINASAAIVDTKLATISTALKVSNSATTATNANTASAIVARDASGDFSAGTITASLSGNASTVTTNANLTGDVTSVGNATSIAAGVIVNADINASAGIVDTKLATISTASKVSNSATTATSANTASAIVARDASGNFTAGIVTATNVNMGFTSTATAAGTTTLTASSTHYQRFTGVTTQTIVLPVTSTLATGVNYAIENASTGNLTVNSSGGNLVVTVIPGVTVQCMCIGTTLTTAADWDPEFNEFAAVTGTGSVVLSTSPTLVTPALGTPASGTLTNCTFPTLNQNTTGSAATLTTGRTIAITGDLAYTSGSFDGSAAVTGTGTLATVNSNVGSFTSASITVNAKGLITAASSGAGASPGGSNTQVQFNNSGAFGGSANLTFNGTNLTCGGTVTANSDERLKTNWRDLPEDFVERLADVKHGVYDRTDIEATQVGVSAQSLQALLKQAVLVGEDGTLSVAYGNAALVACIQLAQRVVALEQTVAKLTKGI